MNQRISREIWLQAKQEFEARLIGQKAWDVRLGHGSFVTMEFGKPLPPNPKGTVHGEWMLWIYLCDWRASDGIDVIDSEESRDKLESWLRRYNGKRIIDFEISYDSTRAILKFENGEIELSPYPDADEDDETWMLFMPDHRVLSAMSTGGWTLEDNG